MRLNLAYQVVHSCKTSWQLMLAMPALLERVATPNLLKRLMQLWANDLYTKCR